MKRFERVVLVAVLLIVCGCTTFRYGTNTFNSEQEALAFQQTYMNTGLAKVSESPTKIGGVLKIHFPNNEIYRTRLVTGNQQGTAADYVIKVAYADLMKIKELFERRKSFDSVQLIYTQGEHRQAEFPNHVMYFYAESTTVAAWYYIGSKVPKTHLAFDKGTTDLGARYTSFAETVEALALAEKLASKRP